MRKRVAKAIPIRKLHSVQSNRFWCPPSTSLRVSTNCGLLCHNKRQQINLQCKPASSAGLFVSRAGKMRCSTLFFLLFISSASHAQSTEQTAEDDTNTSKAEVQNVVETDNPLRIWKRPNHNLQPPRNGWCSFKT